MAVDPPARSLAAPAAFNPAEIDLSSAAFNAARYLAVTHANTSFPELQTALDELRKTTSDKTAQLKALVSAHFDQYLSCHEAVRALAADVTTHQRETETLLADMQHLRRVADASLAVMLQRAREQRRIRHTLAVLARLRPILELTGKMKASLRLQDYDTLAVDYARLKHQSGRISGLAPSLKRVVTAGHEIAATANAELLRRLEDMSVSVTDQKRAIDVLTALGLVEKPILTCLTKQFEYLERKFAEIDDQEASKLGSEEVMKECVAIVGRFRGGLWGFICDLFKIPTGNAAATSNTITSVEAERVQQQAWSILSRCVKLLEHHASPPSAPRLKLLTEAFRQLRYLKKCPNATTLNANIEQLNEFFCYKFRTTITLAYLEQVSLSARSELLGEYFEPVIAALPSFSSEISLGDAAASAHSPAVLLDTRMKIHRVITEARQAFDVIRNASTISSESKILLHRPAVLTTCATDVLQRWKSIWTNVGHVLLDVLDMKDRFSDQHGATISIDDDVDFHFRAQVVQALEKHLHDMLSEFLDKLVSAFVAEVAPPMPVEASSSDSSNNNRGGARVCILLAVVANCVELREKCLRIVDGWVAQLKDGDISQDGYRSEHGRAATSGTRGLSNLVQNVEIKCMDIYSSAHSEPLQRVLRAGAAEEPLQSHNNSSSRHSSRVNTRTGSANLAVQEPLQAPTTIPTVTTSMPSDPRQYVFNVLLQLITLRSEVEMSVGGYPQCWDYVRSVTDPLTAALAEFLQDSMRGLVNASNASAFEEWKRSHLLVEARFFQLALNDLMAVSTKTQLEDVEKQLMQAKPGDQANAGHVTLLNQMKHQTKLYLLALQQ